MRVAFIMLRDSATHKTSYMRDVRALLSERGAAVEIIHPGETLCDLWQLRASHDLFVLKAKTETALSLAGALHCAGAKLLNPYPVTHVLRDRIVATRLLQEAGVPTPESYFVGDPTQLAPLLRDGPLIVKPIRGSRGRGVRIVQDPEELREFPAGEEPVFAQRYYKPDGRDRKMYSIGDELFAVERPWPARTDDEKLGRLIPLTPEMREITLRCGRAFGIDLFGVDIIENAGRLYVVDMSSFPGFKGVPEASRRLADYILHAATQGRKLRSPWPRGRPDPFIGRALMPTAD